jgi:hypothetical protein
MVKKLLTIASIVASTGIFAQQLQNSGFETWASGSPSGWGTADDMLAGTGLASGTTLETQVSPGNSGSSACQLQTQSVSLLFIGNFDVPGIINSAPITLNLTSGSINFDFAPYTSIPTSYSFYYKFSPVNGDTAASICYFTKWNTTTNLRDTIGYGGTLILNSAAAFTQMSVPITWLSQNAPDSIQMLFFSSAGAVAQINTTLTIDDVNMQIPQGINNQEIEKAFNIYPNPASSSITIYSKTENKGFIEVFDLTGRNVGTFEMDSYKKIINLENFENGLYVYKVIDSNKRILHTGKFSVSK